METPSSERGKWLGMEERDTSTGSLISEQGQKFDVFLSHRGKQKNFVRQLHRDLTNQGVSCFFDQDRECLPLAEHFPPHIFGAVKSSQVAVLLLSNDFLGSKWPMLELSAFVEARDKKRTNPNLKILPLFYLISPDALKNTEEYDEKWQEALEAKSPNEREEIVKIWQEALKAIRPINGLRFCEGGDEVKFRDEIVEEIWHILRMASPRYHVRGMQGEARMCEDVANVFNNVQPKEGDVRIVGLYGIAGHGKTTLGKAFCNFCLRKFEGKVCHLEFGRGDSFERAKFALHYLTHRPQLFVQALTNEDEAKVELRGRMKGKRVLLVLDNITEESIAEVRDYLEMIEADSWILLSARREEVLEEHFQIDRQSCMHFPRLTKDEAINILLERAFPVESALKEEAINILLDRGSALKCAERCLFKEVSSDNDRIFHPLALKAFGGYLFTKCGSNLAKWVSEIDAMVYRPGHGLDKLFSVLGKSFDEMPAEYRTIFMLLTIYILPNMSRDKVIEWMAINCNETIKSIEKALQDLREKAFIEEFEPEIRIHDLYIEFAQIKADKMERWLWWKQDLQSDRRGLISKDKDGFELAMLEHCKYETIAPDYVRNLLMLQFVNVEDMSTVDFDPMNKLRSITLRDCKSLKAVHGMEKLCDLAWLQIKGVNQMFKVPDISRLRMLQHLEIDITGSQAIRQLGDLTHCYRLREIYVVCPSLIEFPRLKSMKNLEKVEFRLCDKVEGLLDCRDCVNLQTIVLSFCCRMAALPLLAGCEKLSKIVLSECGAQDCSVRNCPSWFLLPYGCLTTARRMTTCYGLENLGLFRRPKLPSLERLSNLTVLNLAKCGIREPPDLTGCKRLQNIYFSSLRSLKRFPKLSSLRELKKLSLCCCIRVRDPPDIEGCHELQVFHLLYNDDMHGLPRMDKCAQLEEIQVSWRSMDEVGIDRDSSQVNRELEYWEVGKFGKIGNVRMPEELKELECMKGNTILLKKYFRGVGLYYSLTSPYVRGEKFDVFLSHSGKQKNFVRQLHRDLTYQGVSCFLDQDRECLPLAEHFPDRIFGAVNSSQVAVLLLSNDFLGSKWPMVELSAFVVARHKNPNLKILPLFYLISPDALKNTEEIDKKWKKLGI